MAILEVNLEKPALIEEYQFPSESGGRTATTGTGETSSGGGKGKLMGLLVVMAGIALAGWKLKNRGSKTGQTDFDEFEEEEYERGPEPETGADEGDSGKRKIAGLLGLVVAVVSLAAAARKRRN